MMPDQPPSEPTPEAEARSPAAWAALLAGLSAAVTAVAALPTGVTAGLAILAGLAGFAARSARARSARPVIESGEGAAQPNSPDPGPLLDALPMKILLASPDRAVLAVNAKARAAFPGLAASMPLSLALRDPDLLAAFDATARDRQPRVIEWTERGAGERAYRVSVSHARDQIVMAFESLDEVRAADRMRVDFIANASHELRTPLASLLGFIETLQGPARHDSAAQTRFLAIMQEQALRMSRLVNDLLSLSRIEQRAHQSPSEPVDLSSVIEETLDVLRQRASGLGVTLGFARPSAPVIVPGDRDELLRLADNLVENAIKYGRSGGRVEVSLDSDGDRVMLDVRDFGPGIPPEHLPRLTERFYRVDAGKSRESGGTGLGLALVKHIAQRHQARLAITNAEGGGVRVMVSFPRL